MPARRLRFTLGTLASRIGPGPILVGLVVIWGSAFSVINILLGSLSPVTLAATRTVVTALTFAVLWPLRPPRTVAERGDVPRIVVAGLTGFVLYNLLLAWGAQFVSPSVVAVLVSTSPVLIAVAAAMFLSEPLGPRRLAGVASAFAGTVVLVVSGADGFTVERLLAVIALVGTAVCWAVHTLTVKPLTKRYDAVRLSAYGSWISGLVALPVLAINVDELGRLAAGDWLWLIYLGGINGGVAIMFYAWASYRWTAAALSGSLYLVPVASFGWAFVLLGAVPKAGSIVGAAIVLLGLLLLWRSRPVRLPKWLPPTPRLRPARRQPRSTPS